MANPTGSKTKYADSPGPGRKSRRIGNGAPDDPRVGCLSPAATPGPEKWSPLDRKVGEQNSAYAPPERFVCFRKDVSTEPRIPCSRRACSPLGAVKRRASSPATLSSRVRVERAAEPGCGSGEGVAGLAAGVARGIDELDCRGAFHLL